jgi:CheY-like chemotaxis protein
MGSKILIIDDEPDAISFLTTILEDNGFVSISSQTGVEGLEMARKERPDLILLDLIMPEKGGISTFHELKQNPDLSHIPIVVVSGMSQITGAGARNHFPKEKAGHEKEGVEAASTGPDGFVEKPIDPPELIKVIRDILEE